jgi:type IV pilus assembly protein PilX
MRVTHLQSGAALVVGLILLLAITLAAISGINTASLELIMAGNEQYHSRAFHAAESGIEAAWNNNDGFSLSSDYSLNTPAPTGTGNDTFTYTISRPNGGNLDPSPAGYSAGYFGAIYFTISSTGFSERSSSATNQQELVQVVRTQDEFSTKDCGTDDLYNSTASTC